MEEPQIHSGEVRDTGSRVALEGTRVNCVAAEPQTLGLYDPKWQNYDCMWIAKCFLLYAKLFWHSMKLKVSGKKDSTDF